MKQAVVLIHGIGEQKPMDTVRGFVEAVLPPAEPGQEQYWSKPDRMSESFELRRLQAAGRNKIHFFEYYWASRISGTRFRHLAQWLLGLLLRRPRNVPPGLRTVWWLSWLLAGGLVLAIAEGSFARLMQSSGADSRDALLPLVFAALLAAVQGLLLYHAGDAARYLSPTPENIALRQRIRADGVELLRRLHASGEYDRIVVVGHSLGSVIGYDILAALWREFNEPDGFAARGAQLDALLGANQRPQPVVRDALATIGQTLRRVPADRSTAAFRGALVEVFRSAQLAAWKEQRTWGNGWRVTDFVTLGSPLAHAMLLLARSGTELAARQRQRELPTCPPVTDGKRYAYGATTAILTPAGRTFEPLVLHHAAGFAVTRWTNLFFPARAGLFGDLVGGPLADVFGPGIVDVPVGGAWRFTPASHVMYWKRRRDGGGALPALLAALELDRARAFRVPERPREDAAERAALVALNVRIDTPANAGPGADGFPAEVLADDLLFLREGGTVCGKSGPEGLLAQWRQAPAPESVVTQRIAVTLLGRLAVASLVTEETRAGPALHTWRHVRVFSRRATGWQLVLWHCRPETV